MGVVSGHNYLPALENSIDLHVFSCLQERCFLLLLVNGIYILLSFE